MPPHIEEDNDEEGREGKGEEGPPSALSRILAMPIPLPFPLYIFSPLIKQQV